MPQTLIRRRAFRCRLHNLAEFLRLSRRPERHPGPVLHALLPFDPEEERLAEEDEIERALRQEGTLR
jgi:hypothetical protein